MSKRILTDKNGSEQVPRQRLGRILESVYPYYTAGNGLYAVIIADDNLFEGL